MKKFKQFLPVLLILGLLFTGCKKELEGEELDYVGTWEGDYSTISIQTDGHGSYNYDVGMLTKYSNGWVKVKGGKLKIGIKRFDIDEKPHTSGSGMSMTLDGEEFDRY